MVNLFGEEELDVTQSILRQKFIDWNYSEWNGDKFKSNEKDIDELLEILS